MKVVKTVESSGLSRYLNIQTLERGIRFSKEEDCRDLGVQKKRAYRLTIGGITKLGNKASLHDGSMLASVEKFIESHDKELWRRPSPRLA